MTTYYNLAEGKSRRIQSRVSATYHNNGTGGTCHSDGETFLSQHLLINVGEEGVEVMGGGVGERHVTRPLLIKTLMGFN